MFSALDIGTHTLSSPPPAAPTSFLVFLWILELYSNGSLFQGRWFLRQGWLLVVPPTGEPRPRMFFLFSDALLMAKPRPPLHLLKSGTFVCRALYPMTQCQLSRVFGHSGGPCGGLLSVSSRWDVWAPNIPEVVVDQPITWAGSLFMRIRGLLGLRFHT